MLLRRLGDLSGKERTRLAQLLRESRGQPGRLAEKERVELRKLVAKLDLKGAARELAPLLGRTRSGRRGSRRHRKT